MKFAALVLAAAVGAPPSSSPLDEPVQMRMSEAQAAQCNAEGGCGIVTRAYIDQLVEAARQAGKAEAAEQTDAACWRSRKEV